MRPRIQSAMTMNPPLFLKFDNLYAPNQMAHATAKTPAAADCCKNPSAASRPPISVAAPIHHAIKKIQPASLLRPAPLEGIPRIIRIFAPSVPSLRKKLCG